MTATKSRKARNDVTPEVTAQPKSMIQELKRGAPEVGLSVSPDDLGSLFLADATEQGNYESLEGEPAELSLLEGSQTDEALVEPRFEQDGSIWEHSVDYALNDDDASPTRDAIENADTARLTPVSSTSRRKPRSVDTHGASVLEASLLDSETDELGEVESPEVSTDDQEHREFDLGSDDDDK